MKLIGYVFDTTGKAIKIADNLSSEAYQKIWDSLSLGNPHFQGYLILIKEDDES